MTGTFPLLTLRGLVARGLAPVDLDIAAGEAVALMGPSGSGKSLLLRAIADLDQNEGAASVDGADRAAMPAPHWRRQVGYLAAESGWWADGVAEHFERREEAAGLAERLGLAAECMTWSVARLSTGEKQRLALARLLLGAPRVLLLDEPTSGLDASAAGAVEAIVHERLANGAAVLVATHDKTQARRLAKRLLELKDGAVHEVGP